MTKPSAAALAVAFGSLAFVVTGCGRTFFSTCYRAGADSEDSTGSYTYTPPSPVCSAPMTMAPLSASNLFIQGVDNGGGGGAVEIEDTDGPFSIQLNVNPDGTALLAGSQVCFSGSAGSASDGGVTDAGDADATTPDAGASDGGDATVPDGGGGDAGDANDAGDASGPEVNCTPCIPLEGTLVTTTFTLDCPGASSVDEGCLVDVVGTLDATATMGGNAFSIHLSLDHLESWQSVGACAND
jgi:hypothetical protein